MFPKCFEANFVTQLFFLAVNLKLSKKGQHFELLSQNALSFAPPVDKTSF